MRRAVLQMEEISGKAAVFFESDEKRTGEKAVDDV